MKKEAFSYMKQATKVTRQSLSNLQFWNDEIVIVKVEIDSSNDYKFRVIEKSNLTYEVK